jgi:hypothetical protein
VKTEGRRKEGSFDLRYFYYFAREIMCYVHYWHFYKAWYVEVNDNPSSERVFWHNSGSMQECWNEKYLIEGSEWLTHGEIKKKLTEMYPECTLIKDQPFHQGARWRGHKGGSQRGDPISLRIKHPIKERKTARQIFTQKSQKD